MGSLVRNAFIQALRRGLEGSVGIDKVSGKDLGGDSGGDSGEGSSK